MLASHLPSAGSQADLTKPVEDSGESSRSQNKLDNNPQNYYVMQGSLHDYLHGMFVRGRERRWLLPVGLAALPVALPCWWLLHELAYAVHPSYTHKFGDMVRSFFTSGFDRRRLLEIAVCIVGFTVLQEWCLRRWPMTRQRWRPAAAAILALTAAVAGLVLAMLAGPGLHQPGFFFLHSLLWLVPWVAYGYLARSWMMRLETSWERAGVFFGSVLLLGLVVMISSRVWGVMDGESQALFAMFAAIPMISILAGGFPDLRCRCGAWTLCLLSLASCAAPVGSRGAREADRTRLDALDLLEMKEVPEGHYLVTLQSGGIERLINVRVEQGVARCVNSSDPRLKGFEGSFELLGNGVFRVVLRNQEYTASQWWLFRPDGSATVKEVPDRGEKQTAVPVPDDSLGRPGKSPGRTT